MYLPKDSLKWTHPEQNPDFALGLIMAQKKSVALRLNVIFSTTIINSIHEYDLY